MFVVSVHKGNVTHILIRFDNRLKDVIFAEDNVTKVLMHGRASIVTGRVGNGLSLKGHIDGAQLSGQEQASCAANLAKCQYGLMITVWVKLRRNVDVHRYLVSAPEQYSLYLNNRRLYAK